MKFNAGHSGMNELTGKRQCNGNIEFFYIVHPDLNYIRDFVKHYMKDGSLRHAVIATRKNELYEVYFEDGKYHWKEF